MWKPIRNTIKEKLISIRNKPTNKGFTLVELVITIVLVGLASIPLSTFIIYQVEGTFKSHDYTKAINFARFEMGVVNNTAYDSLASANYSNYQGFEYDLDRTVSFILGNGGSPESVKLISVEVRPAGLPDVLTRLTTYRGRNISYGP